MEIQQPKKKRGAPKGGNAGSFKKGQVANPKGRAPLPEGIREITRKTKPMIIEAYWKMANLSLEEARVQEMNCKNLIEMGMLKILLDFADTGNTTYISRIWAECHGLPTANIMLEGEISVGQKRLIEYLGEEEVDEYITREITESGSPEQSQEPVV